MSGAKEKGRERRMVRTGDWSARRWAAGCGLLWVAVVVSMGALAQTAQPRTSPLNAAWAAVGPAQIASQSYGLVTGRVTAVAIDPADASGNTVYLGTTGGGVWKSTNAAVEACSNDDVCAA